MNLPARLRIPDASIARWDGEIGWRLVRTRLTIRRHQFRNGIRRHPGRLAIQTLVVLPAIGLIGLFLFLGLASGFAATRSDGDATALLTTILTLTLIAAFIGSSTTALQSLYLSNDLSFLLTLPIPFRVLFADKFIAAMSGTFPAALFGVISLAAYGTGRGWTVALVPIALIALIVTIVLATATSVFVVALVTRSIPARRARLVLLSISLSIVGLTLVVWNAIAPSQQHFGMAGADQSIIRFGESIRWTPMSWGAQAVAAASSSNLGTAIRLASDAMVLTIIATVTSYQMFARTFSRSVAATRVATMSKASVHHLRLLLRAVAPLPRGIGAVVMKEWLSIFRDFKRLSGVIWPVGVVSIYAISASRSVDEDRMTSEVLAFWQANAPLALLPWGISLGLTIFAFGHEGRAIHLLRLVPIGPRKLFAGKLLAAAIPIAVFSEIVAIIVSIAAGARFIDLLGMTALVAWSTAGFVTIDTAAAAVAPNFEADHIQRSTTLVGRAFGMVMGAAFAFVSAVAVARLIFFSAEPPAALQGALAWEVANIQPLGLPLVIGALLLAAGIVLSAMKVGINRLDDLIRNGP